MNITIEQARKVWDTVNKGLVRGLGDPEPGKMCVEAAVCYALGLPHGDDPGCVSMSVRAFKILLNDSSWSSKLARANGLRELAIAQLGSGGVVDDVRFSTLLVENVICQILPTTLRNLIPLIPTHSEPLASAAKLCETDGNGRAAESAVRAAESASESAAASAALASAVALASASESASESASAEAALVRSVRAAESAAASVRSAAWLAASAASAAWLAASAASAASASVRLAAYDAVLLQVARIGVDILRQMNAPGIVLLDQLV